MVFGTMTHSQPFKADINTVINMISLKIDMKMNEKKTEKNKNGLS